jgi:hypothetical protein
MVVAKGVGIAKWVCTCIDFLLDDLRHLSLSTFIEFSDTGPCVAILHEDFDGNVALDGMNSKEFQDRVYVTNMIATFHWFGKPLSHRSNLCFVITGFTIY